MRAIITLTLGLMAEPVAAEGPVVATDIAPIQSLVAQVMEGIGAPSLTIPAGASPHSYAMRPSEASALQSADLIVWVGPPLTPWMTEVLDNLAPNAQRLTLIDVPETIILPFREHAIFEGHSDEDDDHGEIDPHLWLDPVNAMIWVDAIADQLASLDPENAPRYRTNAGAAIAQYQSLTSTIADRFAAEKLTPFVVFHDAFQYFEARFGLPSAGAISLADASAPSPARLAELRDLVANQGVTCFFAEPQFNPDMAIAIQSSADAKVRILDPLGAALDTGSAHYTQMIEAMVQSVMDCSHD